MVRWCDFQASAPQLASVGFEKLNRKIAYLATLKKDGAPNLHPVTPFIGDGMFFIFTEPSSPKIRDLRRDGRYALHSSVERAKGEPLVEFLVTGTVRIIQDPETRAAAVRMAASSVVIDTYVLFEFLVGRALLVTYNQDGERHLQRWLAGLPPQHAG
jgi:hypothetical protein